MKAVDVVISGRVQMVGFRAFTRRYAAILGVRGYVENLEDGRVHAVLEGDEHQVDKLLEFIKRGPGMAQVRGVKVNPLDKTGYESFDVR